jgi:monoamine oxidase
VAPLVRSPRTRVAPGSALKEGRPVVADVIVIGAGASGLACARSLARTGLDVVVVEARDRVGGRIHTLRDGDEVVEAGAHVVHGADASTRSILEEAGVETAPLERAEIVFWVEGQAYDVRALAAAGVMPPWNLEEFLVRADPGGGSVADLFDALPLGSLERRVGEDWIHQGWGALPAELSAAGLAQAKRTSTAGDGEFVVAGGYDQVAAELARGLDVRTGVAARRVASERGHVEVAADGGELFRARAAVVTVPPTVVVHGDLRFDPPLSPEKLAAARALPLADAVVVVARLAAPAARSSWDFVVGPLSGFWQSRAGARAMVGVSKGESAGRVRDLLGASRRVESLPALLPKFESVSVEDVDVVDWGADPYALGAYSYPGVRSGEAARIWAAPVRPRLFFAGEATCWERHRGMVHGAIDSGLRCADEVRAHLDVALGPSQWARRRPRSVS